MILGKSNNMKNDSNKDKRSVILGIGGYAHDCACAILVDGGLIAASAEERFTRVKHQGGIPWKAIEFCLKQANVNRDQVDIISYGHTKSMVSKYIRTKLKYSFMRPISMIKNFNTTISTLKYLTKLYFNFKRDMKLIKEYFPHSKHIEVFHHNAHAAAVYYTSPFDSANILVVDSNGDGLSTSGYIGEKNKIKMVIDIPFPHSLGNYYLTFTKNLGFRGGEEWKVMGLSSYGEPIYFDEILKIFKDNENGLYKLDLKKVNHHLIYKSPSKPLIGNFKNLRKKDDPIEKYHKDLASSAQSVFEHIEGRLVQSLKEFHNVNNLCISGGAAQNSVANSKSLENGLYNNVFVPGCVTDAGTSIGAAFYVYHHVLNNERKFVMKNDYWGPEFSNHEILKIIELFKLDHEKLTNIPNIVSDLLIEDKIVGLFQGRMEFGERALGNRSILANPKNPAMKDLINKYVKFREEFRPFAPSILKEHQHEYFVCDHPVPFMSHVFDIIPEKCAEIPAVAHVDGTGRLQTVDKDSNELYYDIIKRFYEKTGTPVVLNTSFNVAGEPIVCTPENAIRTFYQCGMDCLVIGNYLIRK